MVGRRPPSDKVQLLWLAAGKLLRSSTRVGQVGVCATHEVPSPLTNWRRCDVFLAVLSDHYFQSAYCCLEVIAAIQQREKASRAPPPSPRSTLACA